ncbi:MAG: hypothetical protein KAY55_04565, partial [Deltaproteobacteria bacterium]|nr:hypothetical protein [Deltaproteobacteria bacterium]
MTQLRFSLRLAFSSLPTAAADSYRKRRPSLLTLSVLSLLAGAAGCGGVGGPEFPFKPEEATIQNVRTAVKTGFLTCRNLAESYQLRHDSLD